MFVPSWGMYYGPLLMETTTWVPESPSRRGSVLVGLLALDAK